MANFQDKNPAKSRCLKFGNKSSICLYIIKNQDPKQLKKFDNIDVFWDALLTISKKSKWSSSKQPKTKRG